MPDDELSFGTPPEPEVTNEDFILAQDEPVGTQEAATTEEATTTDEGFIRLDRKQLGKELSRLQRDDPEFANVLNSLVGQKARAKYQPRVDELSRELDAYRYREQASKFTGLSPEDLGSRMQADPAFAREYSAFRQVPQPEVDNEIVYYRGQVESLMDNALSLGIDPIRVESFRQEIVAGKYDKDSSGQPLGLGEAYGLMQRDLMTEIATANKPVAPQTTTRTATTRPAVSDSASPDLSTTNRSNGNGARFSWAEVKAMNPDQLIQHFPGDDDIVNSIRSGRISGAPIEATEAII